MFTFEKKNIGEFFYTGQPTSPLHALFFLGAHRDGVYREDLIIRLLLQLGIGSSSKRFGYTVFVDPGRSIIATANHIPLNFGDSDLVVLLTLDWIYGF